MTIKKAQAYMAAVFYQRKTKDVEYAPSVSRYLRDNFKRFVDLGGEIEKDRRSIVNDEEFDDAQKIKEVETLFSEDVEIELLPTDIVDKLEEFGITVSVADLQLLDEIRRK